jgi:hypothetical protein
MFATGALLFDERRNLITFSALLVVTALGLWWVLRREKNLDSQRVAA